MFPLLTGLISGGASLLGNIFTADQSAQNTQQQIAAQEQMQGQSEAFNANQAQLNREFQSDQVDQAMQYNTYMSNTAYQRAVNNMKAAGLNPMMMFGSGGPASTPTAPTASGSTASIGTPNVPMPQTRSAFSDLGASVAQGIQSAVSAKTMDKMSSEMANLTVANQVLQRQRDLLGQQTATEVGRTKEAGARGDIATLGVPSASFSAKAAEDLLRMPDWARSAAIQGSFYGSKISDTIAPIVSSAGALSKIAPILGGIEKTRGLTPTQMRSLMPDASSYDEFYQATGR